MSRMGRWGMGVCKASAVAICIGLCGSAGAADHLAWPSSSELMSLAKAAAQEDSDAIRRWSVAGQDLTSWTEKEGSGGCKRVALWVSARPKGVQNYRACGGAVESLGTPGSPVRSPAMAKLLKGLVQKAVLSGEASAESEGFRFEAKRAESAGSSSACAVDLTVRSADLVAVKSMEDGCQ